MPSGSCTTTMSPPKSWCWVSSWDVPACPSSLPLLPCVDPRRRPSSEDGMESDLPAVARGVSTFSTRQGAASRCDPTTARQSSWDPPTPTPFRDVLGSPHPNPPRSRKRALPPVGSREVEVSLSHCCEWDGQDAWSSRTAGVGIIMPCPGWFNPERYTDTC
eukprot:scaffold73_cov337-Pavlova_lutheri.AAC.34